MTPNIIIMDMTHRLRHLRGVATDSALTASGADGVRCLRVHSIEECLDVAFAMACYRMMVSGTVVRFFFMPSP